MLKVVCTRRRTLSAGVVKVYSARTGPREILQELNGLQCLDIPVAAGHIRG